MNVVSVHPGDTVVLISQSGVGLPLQYRAFGSDPLRLYVDVYNVQTDRMERREFQLQPVDNQCAGSAE